jgi:TRAP-type C4-dicarboxylate transport system permease small subunit
MLIKISTMPKFKMGQVYQIFPIAAILCIIAGIVHLLVTLTEEKEEDSVIEEVAKEMEGGTEA